MRRRGPPFRTINESNALTRYCIGLSEKLRCSAQEGSTTAGRRIGHCRLVLKRQNDVMSARSVLMIRPHGFAPDHETAVDNAFQHSDEDADLDQIRSAAASEFESVVAALSE